MPLLFPLTLTLLVVLTAQEVALMWAYSRAVALRPAGMTTRAAWRALASRRGAAAFGASLPGAGTVYLTRARQLGRAMCVTVGVLAAAVAAVLG